MLSDDSAARIISFRQSIASVIAWRGVFVESIGEYIARSNKPRPDIWPARAASLPSGKSWKAVVVSAWDSGSDPALFDKVLVRNADGTPAVIAYDRDARKAAGFLEEIPEQFLRNYGDSVRLFQGIADIQAGRTTPEATFTKTRYQSLKAEDAKTLNNEMNQISQYMHGTHVASILLEGNPYARLFVARHTFDMRIPPAAPSKERAQRIADSFRDIVANMKQHKVRVANMSWSWTTTEIEDAYEQNGIGATSEERRKKARELWDVIAAGLKGAIESAPEILFVASGGNDNSSTDFVQVVPGNLRLPNLFLVGAVDQAGEETGFTSYGSSVIVHANGYEVRGLVPGGHKLPMSGTSMAAPGVANLAAKLLTVAPEMTPQQVIEVIRRTAERTPDGRRNLIHPKNALAAVQARSQGGRIGQPELTASHRPDIPVVQGLPRFGPFGTTLRGTSSLDSGIMLDISSHDVLLVGGGGAGLRAAIAISETDPNLNVAIVSKVYPMRSHTVAAEGGAAGVHLPDDSLDEHAYDTISGGDWLCDQDAVEAFVKEAPEELMRLEHWGCPWSREPDGRVAVRPFGGMKKTRTWFAADKTGFHMLHTLFQTSLKYNAITRYDEYFVTRLLVDDGRVQGVVAMELSTGKIQAITAKAVILCTGGCGRVFRFTTNACY